jgi:hypothetical protein
MRDTSFQESLARLATVAGGHEHEVQLQPTSTQQVTQRIHINQLQTSSSVFEVQLNIDSESIIL